MRNGCLQPSCSQADCGWGAGALHHGKTADVNFDADFDVDVDDRVAEVARRHEGSSPKSLDKDENLTLFCRDIKICRNLRTFWKTLDKRVRFFW